MWLKHSRSKAKSTESVFEMIVAALGALYLNNNNDFILIYLILFLQ